MISSTQKSSHNEVTNFKKNLTQTSLSTSGNIISHHACTLNEFKNKNLQSFNTLNNNNHAMTPHATTPHTTTTTQQHHTQQHHTQQNIQQYHEQLHHNNNPTFNNTKYNRITCNTSHKSTQYKITTKPATSTQTHTSAQVAADASQKTCIIHRHKSIQIRSSNSIITHNKDNYTTATPLTTTANKHATTLYATKPYATTPHTTTTMQQHHA